MIFLLKTVLLLLAILVGCVAGIACPPIGGSGMLGLILFYLVFRDQSRA